MNEGILRSLVRIRLEGTFLLLFPSVVLAQQKGHHRKRYYEQLVFRLFFVNYSVNRYATRCYFSPNISPELPCFCPSFLMLIR